MKCSCHSTNFIKLLLFISSPPMLQWYWSFIFLFFCCLLFLLYFTLQYCMVLPYIDMNPHGCTCVPKHEPPSHLPPHNISLGHHRAPAPSMLYPASDIDWRFDSYMIVYMFQCHSPKSSHPLSLPLSPKVRYTHLCHFCCLAYRVIMCYSCYALLIAEFWVWCLFGQRGDGVVTNKVRDGRKVLVHIGVKSPAFEGTEFEISGSHQTRKSSEVKWKSLNCVRLFASSWKLLCPWNSLGKNTGVGSHSFL